MTEISVVDTNDPNKFNRVIQVSDGGRAFEDWLNNNLSNDELNEWRRVQLIHEQCINDAVSAGDAKRTHYPDGKSVIHWKDEKIHKRWIPDTEDHTKYLEFWNRYFESLK